MITYKSGNILDAPADAVVNTVNTVGVMGKGIALQFRKAFPEMYSQYQKAVKSGDIVIGKVQVVPVQSLTGVRYVINFPTKKHWRHPSRLDWIAAGLRDLVRHVGELDIASLAIPPLGCGNGGLDWEVVRPMIEEALTGVDIHVMIYEPSAEIVSVLKEQTAEKVPKLTEMRAMLLWLLVRYRALGEEVSEFASEKLSYFLQRFGEHQLRLNFEKGHYGPYSGKVRHVLYALNGYYIKGYEQKQAKPFDPLELVVERLPDVHAFVDTKLSHVQRERLQRIAEFIHGYETPYGLELLASVDFVMQNQQLQSAQSVEKALQSWSARKMEMFPTEHIEMAVARIVEFMPHVGYPPAPR